MKKNRDIVRLGRWCIRRRGERVPVHEICTSAQIPRRTFYNWWNRYRQHGLEGLNPRARTPHTVHRTPPKIVEKILRLRQEKGWCPIQVVQINEKDIKDVIVLLREHGVGNEEKETINGDYIAKLLAKDWGFYHTATKNLRLIRDRLLEEDYRSILRDEDINDVRAKIDKVLEMIEEEPKSLAWKMRARTGTKKKTLRKSWKSYSRENSNIRNVVEVAA